MNTLLTASGLIHRLFDLEEKYKERFIVWENQDALKITDDMIAEELFLCYIEQYCDVVNISKCR